MLYISLTWHTDAPESSPLVNAGPIVHAGAGLTLIDVDLTAGPGESLLAVATVRAGSVDAHAVVLAGGT